MPQKKYPKVQELRFSDSNRGFVTVALDNKWYATKEYVSPFYASKIHNELRYKKPGWQGRVIQFLKKYTLDPMEPVKARDTDLASIIVRRVNKYANKESINMNLTTVVLSLTEATGLKNFKPASRSYMGKLKVKGKEYPVFRLGTPEGERAITKFIMMAKKQPLVTKKYTIVSPPVSIRLFVVENGKIHFAKVQQGRLVIEPRGMRLEKLLSKMKVKPPVNPGWFFREKGYDAKDRVKTVYYGPIRDKVTASYLNAFHRGKLGMRNIGLINLTKEDLINAFYVDPSVRITIKKPKEASYKTFNGTAMTYAKALIRAKAEAVSDVRSLGDYAYERKNQDE